MWWSEHEPPDTMTWDLDTGEAGAPGQEWRCEVADGPYRYLLGRMWGGGQVGADELRERIAVWLLLNPSTADGKHDDPRVRRMRRFSQREGCGGMLVVNISAFRSPSPANVATIHREKSPVHGVSHHVIGPDNLAWITWALQVGTLPIAAWGAAPDQWEWARHALRVTQAYDRMREAGGQCLGVTATGHPRHPLYVRADTPLVDLPPIAAAAGYQQLGVRARLQDDPR